MSFWLCAEAAANGGAGEKRNVKAAGRRNVENK